MADKARRRDKQIDEAKGTGEKKKKKKKKTALSSRSNRGSEQQQAAAALAEPITLFRIILLT